MLKKIVGGFVVFIILVVSVVMFVTSGMTDEADRFFDHVKAKQIDQAYTMLSDDFKRATSKQQFENFLIQSALIDTKKTSWGGRSFENNRGQLEGTITTVSGSSVPVTMKFVKGEDGWVIYSIFKPASGVQTETPKSTPPPTTSAPQSEKKPIPQPAPTVEQPAPPPTMDSAADLDRAGS